MKKRWKFCEESYDDRMKQITKFVKPNSSVLDLGCGQEHLRRYIPESCSYQGCDIAKRSENSFVCDFNKHEYPPLQNYDYVCCSGLLEYINCLPSFLKVIKDYSNHFIFSYAVKLTDIDHRTKQDWVNHLTKKEFLDLLKECGYRLVKKTAWKKQIIVYLEKL